MLSEVFAKFSRNMIAPTDNIFTISIWSYTFFILHPYEDIISNTPGYRISNDIHRKYIFASGGHHPQHVTGVSIPPTTHQGTQWDRLSNCVRRPGHTAPWRHRQDDMVCCVPDSFAIKPKIAQVVATRCVAMPNINVSVTIQPSQARRGACSNQTGSTVQFIHRPWNQTLQILLLPEDLHHQLTVWLGHDTGVVPKYTHNLPGVVHENSTYPW